MSLISKTDNIHRVSGSSMSGQPLKRADGDDGGITICLLLVDDQEEEMS